MRHGVVRAGARDIGNTESIKTVGHRETLDRYARLAKAMARTRNRGDDSLANPHIPAGYTYLGQFIAHDIAFHETRAEHVLPGGGALIGGRTPRLDLDSLYGDGPEVDPHRFRREATSDGRWRFALAPALSRHHTRLRAVDKDDATIGDGPTMCVFGESIPDADLPRRAPCPALPVFVSPGVVDRSAAEGCEALVADPRNDENLLISQLTVTWMKLHNLIAQKVAADMAGDGGGEVGAEQANAIFLRARKITVRCYQNVILHDYLRRLLHPDVYRDLTAGGQNGPAFLMYVRDSAGVLRDRIRGDRFAVPPEFWAAAFRTGHVMIQSKYWANDAFGNAAFSLMKFMELTGPTSDETPLKDNWVLDMGRFFFRTGLGGEANDVADGVLTTGKPDRKANFSHRLHLSTARELGPDSDGVSTVGGSAGLIYSDLLRGLAARLGAPAMRTARQLLADFPALAPASMHLDRQEIRIALEGVGRKQRDKLSAADLAALSEPSETPLLIYLLAEAQSARCGDNGRHLGPVGSRLVGEVIVAAITAGGDWRSAGQAAEQDWRALFGAAAPRSMPEVLEALG